MSCPDRAETGRSEDSQYATPGLHCEGFLKEGGGEEGCQTSPPSRSSNFTVPQDGIVIGEQSRLCYGWLHAYDFCFSVVWGIVVPSDSLFDGATHLCFGDISVNSRMAPSALMMHLKSSKTDPFRRGGLTCDRDREWGNLPSRSSVKLHGAARPCPGPLSRFSDGSFLTRATCRFVVMIRSVLLQAGTDAKPYLGHSFQIGVATTSALSGTQDSLIKVLGRWQSSAHQLYIQTPPEDFLRAVARQLL